MEDALHEINDILERKDINDKHKAMILGDEPKRFYNLYCEILPVTGGNARGVIKNAL